MTVTEDDLMDEIAKDFLTKSKLVHFQPGDITSKMAAQEWGISEKTSIRRLHSMTHSGKLQEIPGAVLPNGRIGIVWRIVSKENKRKDTARQR